MKKILLSVCIISGLNAVAQTEKTYASKDQRKAFYKQLATKYNSTFIQEILKADETDHFEAYIDGKTEKELLESYSTVVHELLHDYNESENNGHHYAIDKGKSIFASYGKYYRSTELNSFVRKGLQDSIFRYGIYIGGKKEVGHEGKKSITINNGEKNVVFSITNGLYGILEEYSAYYYGNEAIAELYPYYQKTYKADDSDAWKDYKHEVTSDQLAYYEFRLFIAWYLIYARQKHPDIYRDLQNNTALRVVYTLIDEKYRKLDLEIEKQLLALEPLIGNDLVEMMDFSGSDEDLFTMAIAGGMDKEEVYTEETKVINGKSVTIKKSALDEEDYDDLKKEYNKLVKEVKLLSGGGMTMYFAKTKAQISYLKKQYSPEVLEELEQFRIAGVTETNYSDFLK